MRTLIDLIEDASSHERSITFIDRSELALTYQELYRKALHIKHALLASHAGQNEIILLCEKDQHFVAGLWGIILSGKVPVPLAAANHFAMGGSEAVRFANVYAMLKAPILTDGNASSLAELAGAPVSAVSIEAAMTAPYDTDVPVAVSEDDVALIQFSSGSTGKPKGVMLTHKNLLTNARQVILHCGFTNADVSLNWMPLYHDLGLILFHITSLMAGMDQVKMSVSAFIKNPIGWLKKAAAVNASVLYATNFALELVLKRLDIDLKEAIDLSHVKCCFVGAEPISPTIFNDFIARTEKLGLSSGAVIPSYGLAEASVAAILSPVGQLPVMIRAERGALIDSGVIAEAPDGVRYMDCGVALAGIAVAVRDEEGHDLPENRIGELCIRGDNVMKGYYGMAREETFHADGYLPTGDLGFCVNGRYSIVGRKKEVLFVYGKNYYASDIEDMIKERSREHFSYLNVVGAQGRGDGKEKVLLFFYPSASHTVESIKPELMAVKEHVNKQMGFPIHHFIAVRRKEIAKTTSGKVMRYHLAEAFNEGAFDAHVVAL